MYSDVPIVEFYVMIDQPSYYTEARRLYLMYLLILSRVRYVLHHRQLFITLF